ncbi:hypothetical protein ACFQYP_62830 [Nonomuraea antimicrobica]
MNELAAHPEEWGDQVDFPADGGRHYASLYRDAYVDVWLLCWRPEDDTGWHDHDISSGAVHVVEGRCASATRASGASTWRRWCRRGSRSRSGPTTSTGSPARWTGASRSTPTRRRCGGWDNTRSTGPA